MDAEAPLLPGHAAGWNLRTTFGASVGGLLAVLLAGVAAFTTFSEVEILWCTQYRRGPLPAAAAACAGKSPDGGREALADL